MCMIHLWKNNTSKTWCFKTMWAEKPQDFMISSLSLPPVGFFFLLFVVCGSSEHEKELKPCSPGVPASA